MGFAPGGVLPFCCIVLERPLRVLLSVLVLELFTAGVKNLQHSPPQECSHIDSSICQMGASRRLRRLKRPAEEEKISAPKGLSEGKRPYSALEILD